MARTLGISERRLLGWEPEERHEHRDPEGNLTGYTVVVREPEWDDLERDKMLALVEYEAGICDCGYHESLTDDRDNFFTFDLKTCPVCKASAQYARMQADTDKRAVSDDQPPSAPQPSDGRRTFVRRLSASEAEERRSRRASSRADA